MKFDPILDFLVRFQWLFAFVFSVAFGVVANECYLILKGRKRVKFQLAAKATLAYFICILFHGYYQAKNFDAKVELYFIMLVAFLYYPIAGWLVKEALPFFIDFITKGRK